MVGIVDTGAFAKRLWPGVKAWFGYAYDEYATEYTEIFETQTSDKRYEDIVSMAGIPLAVVKGEGSPINYFSPKQGFTSRYYNTVYGTGFIITKEMLDDDQYAEKISASAAKNAAFSMRQTKEVLGANVLNNATSGSYLGGDGFSLASSAHPLYGSSGGSYSNVPTVAADFSEASLEQALIDIAGFVDDANLKIAIRPNMLIIPRQLIFDVRRVLMDDDRPGTANRDINASKGMLAGGYTVNHYLTAPATWFVRNDVPDSLVHMEREGYEMESDYDFDTSNTKFKFTERYAFGWSDARGVYVSAGP